MHEEMVMRLLIVFYVTYLFVELFSYFIFKRLVINHIYMVQIINALCLI